MKNIYNVLLTVDGKLHDLNVRATSKEEAGEKAPRLVIDIEELDSTVVETEIISIARLTKEWS